MEKTVVGIDLGGTFIKAGILDARGKIYAKRKIPTRAERGYRAIAEDMRDLAQALAEESNIPFSQVRALGVGSPGHRGQRGRARCFPTATSVGKTCPLPRNL